MPLTKSAKKALLVSKRRKLENDVVRAKIKSAVKGARLSIAAKKSDVPEKIQTLYKELDLAAKKHVIHKNKAARLKSRITKTLAKSELNTEKPAKNAASAKGGASVSAGPSPDGGTSASKGMRGKTVKKAVKIAKK